MKRLPVPAAFAAVLSCVLVAPAFASENTPLQLEEETRQASSGGGSLVRTIVGLAIVLGVIYGLHWVLKQVKASREGKTSGSGLASLSTLPLGTNRSVHVVRAGDEILVLGATEHGITQLRVYTDDEARAAGLLDEPEVIDVAPSRPAAVLDTLRTLTVRR
jgi:flagellar protein FliO/FliZ